MIRNIQKVSDDIIEIKRLIKQKLIADTDILEALHNPAIDIDSPDEFLDNNIYGFIRIPQTQDTVRNFICFTVDDIEDTGYNSHFKVQQIKFVCICHLDDMKTEFGIDRHDLLAYLVRSVFNWSNDFGLQFKLVYNQESTIDSDYYCRTLKFERECTNSLNKATRSNVYDRP
jgi:hypothetical protein